MVDVGDLHIFGTNGGVTKCNIYVYIIMHTYVYIYIYIYIYERGMDFVAAPAHSGIVWVIIMYSKKRMITGTLRLKANGCLSE